MKIINCNSPAFLLLPMVLNDYVVFLYYYYYHYYYYSAICDKKAHWDKRYYIEIIYGRGEVVRPCPPGTIFFSEKCTCDYGLSALLPESHGKIYREYIYSVAVYKKYLKLLGELIFLNLGP